MFRLMKQKRFHSNLVSTDWLANNFKSTLVIDASWHMNTTGESVQRTKGLIGYVLLTPDYELQHIPGSRFFDIDAISDTLSSLPHMLPTECDFERHMGDLGISNDDHIVVYDTHGIFSSPRVWWTFKAFGHQKVSVLDGGFKKWLSEKRPVTDLKPEITPTKYTAKLNRDIVIDYNDLCKNIS